MLFARGSVLWGGCAIILLLAFCTSTCRVAAATDTTIQGLDDRLDKWSQRLSEAGRLSPQDSFTFNIKTVATLILTCLCALLANAAGIGGGPIYLPLLMVVLGFNLTPATALSHTIVACSAIASSIYGLIAQSPNDPSRSLIDWDLTIFIPALLVGVSIGVYFNVLLPSWLQTILLTVLLLVVVYKTLGKGLRMWQSEKKDAALKQKLLEDHRYQDTDSESETEGFMHDEAYHVKPHRMTRQLSQQILDRELDQAETTDTASRPPTISENSKLQSLKHSVRGCFGRQPFFKIISVVVLWVVFLTFQQLKTRHSNCSWPYFGLFIGEVILFLIATAAGIYYLAQRSKAHPDDVDPELRSLLLSENGSSASQRSSVTRLSLVAVVMIIAGALAGLLGIGDKPILTSFAFIQHCMQCMGILSRALIFNPFLLALGVNPQVTASTSVLMILFSSSAIAISFGFQGYLNVSYAAVLAPVAFVSSIIGVTLIGKLIKKTGHTSIIVFILTFLIVIGTILTAVFGGIDAVKDFKQGNIGFKDFCQ